jgi:hypothetical protein
MAIPRKKAHDVAHVDVNDRIRGRRHKRGRNHMAKGEQRSNRETKKPKKEKIKTIAAAPSQKTGGWQPTANTGKKK